jgi:hypothetical protein
MSDSLGVQVRDYLIGSLDVPVYYGDLDEDMPSIMIIVYDAPGTPGWPSGSKGIQLLVKHPLYEEGMDLARSAFNVLQGKPNLFAGVSWCQASSDILFIGKDDQRVCRFSINFRLSIRTTSM